MQVQLISHITDIGGFIFLAWLAAGLELAFQEYQDHDMIFEWYHDILEKWYLKRGLVRKLAMLLGLCTFCNGFWVALITYLIYFKDVSLTILLFCGLNYLFIKIFSGIFNIIFKIK